MRLIHDRRFLPVVLLLLSFTLSRGSLARAQETPPNPSIPELPDASGQRGENPDVARAQREMRKKANKERQEQLKKDTDELLKLATELKEYVDKTNENILSLDVVKKAEQIEKLAHSVKEKMRISY